MIDSPGVFAECLTSVSVLEGDSVTLNIDLTQIIDDYLILWRFVNALIAGIVAAAAACSYDL